MLDLKRPDSESEEEQEIGLEILSMVNPFFPPSLPPFIKKIKNVYSLVGVTEVYEIC